MTWRKVANHRLRLPGGRSGEHARQFLGNWHGYLMVDDYGGYKALFTTARQSPALNWAAGRTHAASFFDLQPGQ